MLLEAQNLVKSYHLKSKRIQILNGLNLSLEPESITAIVGPSGSGKSTLLSILAGLDKPEQGQLTIKGQSFSAMNEQKTTSFRGKHIGIVFQQFHLIGHMTALENVALPIWLDNNLDAEDKAIAALEEVGLKDRQHHKPHELSGGECQRVAIARALINRPPLILADEPTGNLDRQTGIRVVDMLFSIIKEHKTALVLVTHDQELAKRCDKQFELEKGILTQSMH